MAVDIGDGLTDADAKAIVRFRENGGGVLTARDHEDLGSCLCGLGSVGLVNQFHDKNVDPSAMRDDQDTPTISWPNYHSGANGDYQPVFAGNRCTNCCAPPDASGRIEWFPAHPHEGAVSADVPVRDGGRAGPEHRDRPPLQPRRRAGRRAAPDGRPMGRALAESTFHHFADYNWDLDCGAPSFVTEPPGTEIKADPSRLAIFKDYVRNIATWLQPATSTPWDHHGQRIPAHQ